MNSVEVNLSVASRSVFSLPNFLPAVLVLALIAASQDGAAAQPDVRWDKPRYLWHSSRLRADGVDGKPVVFEREDYELSHQPVRTGLQDFGIRGGYKPVYEIDWVGGPFWTKDELCAAAAPRGPRALAAARCTGADSAQRPAPQSNQGGDSSSRTPTPWSAIASILLLLGALMLAAGVQRNPFATSGGDAAADAMGPTDALRVPTNLAQLGVLLLLLALAIAVKETAKAKPGTPAPPPTRRTCPLRGPGEVFPDGRGGWVRMCVYACPDKDVPVPQFMRDQTSLTDCAPAIDEPD